MFLYRIYGIFVSLLFVTLASVGHSCEDDRGSGLASSAGYGRSGGSAGGGSYRTYHK